jgi:hypothetical protein
MHLNNSQMATQREDSFLIMSRNPKKDLDERLQSAEKEIVNRRIEELQQAVGSSAEVTIATCAPQKSGSWCGTTHF